MRSDPAQRENAKSNTACGCLFCITGKECLVAMRVQTLYPQIHAVAVRKEKHLTREGRKLRAEVVLLPSYVFFEAPADADVSALAELQDVIRILSMDAGVWQLQGEDERFARAAVRAEKVLARNARSLYHSAQLDVQMRAVLAACAEGVGRGTQEAVTAYRQSYLAAQPDVDYHLLMARHHLNRQHVQAAEHEIWSITDLPEGRRAEYLILRGRLAAAKEQYETAAEYLRQADALSPLPKLLERELCRAMELCCRERQDYKAAYEYAARQLRL